jgi:hypothetical protein
LPEVEESKSDPGFLERGGLRRRLRFLRKARELAYRDLGGLVFEMHRVGQQRDELLQGKLATLRGIDSELRSIEQALRERHGVTVLREAGVTACPRCAAIHGSEDRFCPACGFSISRGAERPIAAQPLATTANAAQPVAATANATPATVAAPAPTAPPAPPTPPAPTAPPVSTAPPASPTPPAPAQSPGATPAPAGRQSSPKPWQSPAATPRAPNPPPPADEGKDQPTEVIDPPTQIIRPGQPRQT